MANAVYNATGRRKESIARVFMTPGKGNISINGRHLKNILVGKVWQLW